jgi:hypothetical protein
MTEGNDAPRRNSRKRTVRTSPNKDDQFTQIRFGITDNAIAAALGHLVAYWPNVEDRMIYVFHELIHGAPSDDTIQIQNTRLIFQAVGSQHLRLKMMKDALERGTQNIEKPDVFDEIIREFREINEIRNRYAHGVWFASEGAQRYTLVGREGILRSNSEIITAADIHHTTQRMRNLFTMILRRNQGGLA